MKRGIIQLSLDEVNLLQDLPDLPAPLVSKIGLINSSSLGTQLEINADEAETILDILPPPDPNQPNTQSLRSSLQNILR